MASTQITPEMEESRRDRFELLTELCVAALKGDVLSLIRLHQQDEFILDRCSVQKSGHFTQSSPLHVAASLGHLEFVKKILDLKPKLAAELLHGRNQDGMNPTHIAAIRGELEVLDELLHAEPQAARELTNRGETILHLCMKHRKPEAIERLLKAMDDGELLNSKDSDGNTVLHLAAATGYIQIVEAVVAKNPSVCFVRNQDGMNSAHVAAIKGELDVLDRLLLANPQMARELTSGGETILHLCVKHRKPEALEHLVKAVNDGQLLNSKDSLGNTVLHLAVATGPPQMVKYLLEDERMDINAINANDFTAMDICLKSKHKSFGREILKSFNDSKALAAKAAKVQQNRDRSWSDNQCGALMVVASLIATIAFQGSTNPPGGVWQDDDEKKNRTAGRSVMGDKSLPRYEIVIIANTVGLVSPLSVIVLLISGFRHNRYVVGVLMVIMWMAVSATAVTYVYSVAYVSPWKETVLLPLFLGLIGWMILMALLLVAHSIWFMVRLIKKLGRWVKKTIDQVW